MRIVRYTSEVILFLGLTVVSCTTEPGDNYRPELVGQWWQVAGNPDLGAYTSPGQQPVDFGIWKASDGTWQLWSCIRHTNCGGQTRLFYGWEGDNLTDTAWKALGIMMEADTLLGETAGGLQAPHVILENGTYYMFYGDWQHICLATSTDGKNFERYRGPGGGPQLFTGPLGNTRDPMVLKIGETFYCYYMGHDLKGDPESAIFCRTSTDLFQWSEPVTVSAGGMVASLDGWGGGDAECPFVIPLDDRYMLFRNQRYGTAALNTQYFSDDPEDFGVNDDRFMVWQLPVAAPEIIFEDEEYYMAALMPGLDGIRISRIRFNQINNKGKQ